MRILLAVLWMIVPIIATAQPTSPPATGASPRERDFQLRVNGPVRVAGTDTVSTVWVVNGDATVDGVVREGLGVINGTARIAGHVQGGIVVVNGHLDLLPGARVDGDVAIHGSTLTRAPAAVVRGVIHQRTGYAFGMVGMWVAWLGFSVVVVTGGLLFAGLAPHQLIDSAGYLAHHPGRSALGALIMVAGLPALAMMSLSTVIGIPLGLTILFVVIPAMSFLGYLVAGDALGAALLTARRGDKAPPARYGAIVLGLLVLQLVAFVPGIGVLAVLIASQIGFGALVARSWSDRRRVDGPVGIPATVPA